MTVYELIAKILEFYPDPNAEVHRHHIIAGDMDNSVVIEGQSEAHKAGLGFFKTLSNPY